MPQVVPLDCEIRLSKYPATAPANGANNNLKFIMRLLLKYYNNILNIFIINYILIYLKSQRLFNIKNPLLEKHYKGLIVKLKIKAQGSKNERSAFIF